MHSVGRLGLAFVVLLSFLTTPPLALAQDAPPADGDEPAAQLPAEPGPRHRIGHYTIELPGLPYRVVHETRLRYGWEPRDSAVQTYRRTPDQPTNDGNRTSTDWFIEVPATYRIDRPAGLLVFVRGGAHRRCPEPWRAALSEHNLIYVGFPAGSASKPWFAHARAIVAVQVLAERYRLDPRRIYLVGMDNGATVACAATVLTPEYFRAAFVLHDAPFPADLPLGDSTIDGFAPGIDRRTLRAAAQRATLVMFNGKADIDRDLALMPAAAYDRAGFNITLIDQPGQGSDVPEAEHLRTAIHAFEQPYHREAGRGYERGVRLADRDQPGEAIPMLLDALSIGTTAPYAGPARAKLTALQDAYAAEVSTIEAHLAAGEIDEAAAALGAFDRRWRRYATDDTERLERLLLAARRAARE